MGVELDKVAKDFAAVRVIRDVSMDIPTGSFAVFVGPSGCGKSTLLRMIAGLEDTSGGKILIDDRDVTQAKPADRGVAMVFQSYALYPHLTVFENMAFSLRLARTKTARVKEMVTEAARVLQLEDHLEKKPSALSGGQRQRVAIGRAIVRQPSVFLFDEPLSNLDAELRVAMRLELTRLHRKIGATMIYVTHDQVEAMTLADQIVVMNRGRIEQVGAPMDLYDRPMTEFVAGFIGSPKMNLLPGAAIGRSDVKTVGIRPEHLRADPETGDWPATAKVVETLGADTVVYANAETLGEITVRLPGKMRLSAGERLFLSPEPGNLHLFDEDGHRMEQTA